MHKSVRRVKKRTCYKTPLHCCLLTSGEKKSVVTFIRLFPFSIIKNGVADLSKTERKTLRKIGYETVQSKESKHRLRTYTKAACRAVARTHLVSAAGILMGVIV